MTGVGKPDLPQPNQGKETSPVPQLSDGPKPPNRVVAFLQRMFQRKTATQVEQQATQGQHHEALQSLADQSTPTKGTTIETTQAKDPYGNNADLALFMEQERRHINYAEIASTSRVVALGEQHGVEAYQQEEKTALAQLKNAGFTHVGLEMVTSDMQPLLDEYIQTGKGREEILKHIQDGWGWTPEQYMNIIDSAKRMILHTLKRMVSFLIQAPLDLVPAFAETEYTV